MNASSIFKHVPLVRGVVALCLLAGSGCASEQNIDPLEPVNRKIFAFNEKADAWVIKPLAEGYVAVTPRPVRTGVDNFFSNLRDPVIAVNQFLQGKPERGLMDTSRFLVNTTLGLGGLFDPASGMGLEKHQEDLGQTLGVWGFDRGIFLMAPFWGPVTVRDGFGDFFEQRYGYLPRYLVEDEVRHASRALQLISIRAGLLGQEELISGDRYLFMRDAYLQRRKYLIEDGEVISDPFLEGGEF